MNEYNEKQQEIIKEYKELGRRNEIQGVLKNLQKKYNTNKNIIPRDLAYLEKNYREDYLHDMKICQEFASSNRTMIAKLICDNLDNVSTKDSFETIHNYIDLDSNIVRKGAISAKKDELLLIPINMRDGCIIGKGKGNDDWNMSAPHGAGRIMSRTQAKKTFDLEEFKKSMKGIYTTSVNKDTLDEAPFVYKPIQEIIDNIKDTVEIIQTIKPIYNFKAGDVE
jgi:RNA-splicing ligase RtcB